MVWVQGLVFRDAVLGGYIIQSWSAVKAGFSINIKLPSNWYNSKWIGFALWASLSIPRVVEVKDGIRARVNHCAFEDSTTYINDICLLYLSREDWFGAVQNDECSQITVMFENKNSIFFENCNDNSIFSSFEHDNSSYSIVQISGGCGFNLIYEQGVVRVDELNETNAPCFIESFGKVSIYKLTGKSPSQPSFSLMVNPILSYFLSNYIYIWFCHWQVSQVIFLFLLLAHHVQAYIYSS